MHWILKYIIEYSTDVGLNYVMILYLIISYFFYIIDAMNYLNIYKLIFYDCRILLVHGYMYFFTY